MIGIIILKIDSRLNNTYDLWGFYFMNEHLNTLFLRVTFIKNEICKVRALRLLSIFLDDYFPQGITLCYKLNYFF